MSKQNVNEKSFEHGAEWVRADFHLHTDADGEFRYSGDSKFYNSAYVDALENAGIRLGVITNHNKFDAVEFKALRTTAKKQGISLLPGVELSVGDGAKGVHTLIVFSDQWLSNGENHINPFLNTVFTGRTPDQYECENGRTQMSLLQVIQRLDEYHKDYFLVFAHVEQPCGIWKELDGGRLTELAKNELFTQRTLGFQKVRTHDGAKKNVKCRTKVQLWMGDAYPAEVEGSDPKSIEEIGKGEACYIKLGELSFEAVKFALFDHKRRVRKELPNRRDSVVIDRIRFEGGTLNDSEIFLSSSLNCLIGPRGNGKSAIIETLRHSLGLNAESDDRYKNGLVNSILSPAGKVIVEATDEFGRHVRIEREQSGYPSVYLDGVYRDVQPGSILKDILYFGQKDLSTRSESFDENFLDKLLADRLDGKPSEEARLIESVRQATRQLKDVLAAGEQLEAARKEKGELEVQLQIYVDKGVDKTLAEMTLFDSDRNAIAAWKEAVEGMRENVGELADWDDLFESFPTLRSTNTKKVHAKVDQSKTKLQQAKQAVDKCAKQIAESLELISDALKGLEPIRAEIKTKVAELQRTLNEPKLDLEVFRKKKARLEQLRKLIVAGTDRAKTEQVARDLLGAATRNLHEFWRLRFNEREAEIRSLEELLPSEIRFRTQFRGKRKAFEEFLRTIMRGSGLQGTVYEDLGNSFADGRELYQSRLELDRRLSEAAAAKVKLALLDNLVDFLVFRTPDITEILYEGKPLGEYSLGQRATVILHILMHLRRHPVIIIDQPEDDLDNETLYSHFISQLLERKEKTQFIFATHNANIPVLGDCDQAIVCRNEAGTFSFEHGSIDDKAIQNRIVTVMEGGEDAFRRRKEIYQLWKSSN